MTTGRYPALRVDPDPQPADRPFRLVAERVTRFSRSGPATVRVAFENLADGERRVGFGAARPFPAAHSEGGEMAMVPSDPAVREYAIAADGEVVPDAPVEECWRTTCRFTPHDVLRWASLAPGETVAAEYVLLDDGDRDCLPTGRYRFVETFALADSADGDWAALEWGFDVHVADSVG